MLASALRAIDRHKSLSMPTDRVMLFIHVCGLVVSYSQPHCNFASPAQFTLASQNGRREPVAPHRAAPRRLQLTTIITCRAKPAYNLVRATRRHSLHVAAFKITRKQALNRFVLRIFRLINHNFVGFIISVINVKRSRLICMSPDNQPSYILI